METLPTYEGSEDNERIINMNEEDQKKYTTAVLDLRKLKSISEIPIEKEDVVNNNKEFSLNSKNEQKQQN